MTAIADLPTAWRSRAKELEPFAPAAAQAFTKAADELESTLTSGADEVVTIGRGAALSGYSSDHLRHLIRTGVIPNRGRHGSPRVRVGDLPKKPGAPLPGAPRRLQVVRASPRQAARDVARQP